MKTLVIVLLSSLVFLSSCSSSKKLKSKKVSQVKAATPAPLQAQSIYSNKDRTRTRAAATTTTTTGKDYFNGIKPDFLAHFDVLKYIVEIANRKRDEWLLRDSEVPAFNLMEPIKPIDTMPDVRLTRHEFETTTEFNKRVLVAEGIKQDRERSMELEYQDKLSQYNNSLREYTLAVSQEKAQRLAVVDSVYLDFIKSGIEDVLGTPYIRDLSYDADLEKFSGVLYSKTNNFSRNITIRVPLSIAKEFRQNLVYVLPNIDFALSDRDGSLYISKITVLFKGKLYPIKMVRNAISLTTDG